MTNYELMLKYPIEDFAKLLIKEVVMYDYEDESIGWMTSDGKRFYVKDSAISYEIEWLNKQVERVNENT